MNVGIVVGRTFRNRRSVRNYVDRMRPTDTVVLMGATGMAALNIYQQCARLGRPMQRIDRFSANDELDIIQQRIEFVEACDKVVLFDDGAADIEHVRHLAEVNKKVVVQFKEVATKVRA